MPTSNRSPDRRRAPTRPVCALAAVAGLLAAAPAAADHHETPLLAPGATVEKLADGFRFTEGPACDRARGDVYFSDIPNDRILRWSKGEVSTFRDDSGGANGLYLDRAGHLIVAEGGSRRVTRITGAHELLVVADAYQGKKLNSPNDLWVDPGGGVYFSDPRYGDASGVEQDGQHVYYVPSGGEIRRVTDDLEKPNGVLGTPYAEKLYVADAGAGVTYEYRIELDGSLVDRKVFASQGSDGMTRDERGNLYLTDAGITVYDPTGKKLTTIEVPERPSNMVFCGEDGKTLFITARTGLYSLRMNVAGQ